MPLLFVENKSIKWKMKENLCLLACDGVTDKARQRLDLPEEMKMKN